MGISFDTNFLIDLLRGDEDALSKAREIDELGETKYLSTPVLYEIQTGLFRKRSRSEVEAFRALASRHLILSFDEEAAYRAGELRAELHRLGRPKSHVDVMVAGIAIARGLKLVSRDEDIVSLGKTFGFLVERY